MELYLVRHGHSDPAEPGGSDEHRQLSERGRKQVALIARALARAEVRPQAILVSPLLRARQTGEILAGALCAEAEVSEALRPGCRLGSLQALLLARRLERLMLVGHQPDLSAMVSQLIGGGNLRMQTGAAAGVEASALEPGQGVLMWLLTPALA